MSTSASPEELPFGLEKKNDIFNEKKVYYSGSIKGELPDPLIGYELVKHMIENGANVLSAHVAARNPQEMLRIFEMLSGEKANEHGGDKMDAEIAYKVDMGWVDDATHLVAVVDGASHGVGMEIMRALLKPQRGLSHTPVLCLASTANIAKISGMILGAHHEFGKSIVVKSYDSTYDAKAIVGEFLSNN